MSLHFLELHMHREVAPTEYHHQIHPRDSMANAGVLGRRLDCWRGMAIDWMMNWMGMVAMGFAVELGKVGTTAVMKGGEVAGTIVAVKPAVGAVDSAAEGDTTS